MSNPAPKRPTAKSAFTLIELLVVIAIIGVLAALIFPAAAAIKKRAIITKTQTELDRVIVAIDLYKEKIGSYPPDNPCGPVTNQLYFELVGTELRGGVFQALDGVARVSDTDNDFGNAFGRSGGKPCVRGFVNSNKTGGDEGVASRNFLKTIKPGQYGAVSANAPEIRLLACSVGWPANHPFQPVPNNPGLNPWRYNSSNPTNSPSSYDLWVDIMIGGKTNRIGNWRRQPVPVTTP